MLQDSSLGQYIKDKISKCSYYDFSVSNALNVNTFLGNALCSPLEGSMSQNFDLGPGYFFMLCRKFVKVFFSLFFTFYIIKIKLRPKSKF